ncbi:trimethyllysine dioxygenase, mitochondrial-like [Antedon mediterranea]|uniref:trimethyllysine dioxygenase, mitochondrial-like n=1 Tax=Antedon mediterranea TaxID=105859 RepID=UPI003AF85E70
MKLFNICFKYSLRYSQVRHFLRTTPVSKNLCAARCLANLPPDDGNTGSGSLLGLRLLSTSSSSGKFSKHDLKKERQDDVVVTTTSDHIVINENGISEKNVSGMWLRDHCRCQECFSETRYQNLYDPSKIETKPTIAKLEKKGNSVHVDWNDGHSSVYTLDYLLSLLDNRPIRYPNRRLWNAEKLTSEIADVSFQEYMNETEGLAKCLRNLYTYGIAFIDNVPLTKEDFLALSERICFLRECEHGRDNIVISSKEKMYDDIAYTNHSLGFHTDSAYSVEPLGYLTFHLMEHTGEGGLGCYVDGFHVSEIIRKSNPDAYRILSEVLVKQEFIDKHVHYKGNYPVFTIRDNEVKIIRYQTTDRISVQHLSLEETEQFYDGIRLFNKLIYSPENEFWIKYNPGRVVIFDNFRLLHGRSMFTGTRVIRNTVLPRDEVDSRIRKLTGLG